MTLSNIQIDYTIRILASFVCGLILGFERKTRQHTIGMRTLILISVSSSLLTILSISITQMQNVTGGDPTRIAAGIVTGIGFLGGGVIVHQGLNIRGLTSAAIIWSAASLGIACGSRHYYIAGITLTVMLLSLLIFEKIEFKLFPAEKYKTLKLTYNSKNINLSEIQKSILSSGLILRDTNMTESIANSQVVLKFSVKAPGEFQLSCLTEKLTESENLIEISLSDD